jgi:HJR/Mrr/RecB family endonuclease
MARRRKNNDDFEELIVKLVGLMILIFVITPQGRQFLAAISALAISGFILVAVGLVAFVIFRRLTRSESAVPIEDAPQFPPKSASLQTTADLLQRLRAIDWFQFEKIVALAYEKQGYSVARRGGANPDGGIDLVIEMNGQQTAVQCKQWKTWNVGVKAMREFLGALTDAGFQKGIFITIRGYTSDAKELAEKHGIEILNEIGLAQLLETTDAKSDPEVLELLRDRRKFCPRCESEMILRTASKGLNAGNQFWGCSEYPRCRFTMPLA